MTKRQSLLSRSAPIQQLIAKRPHVLGNRRLGTARNPIEIPDVPAPVFSPREKYLDEAPSGRLGEMLKKILADHPELEPYEFSPRNIRNWSVCVPGTIQTEAGTIHGELQVERHVVGMTDDEPVFRDRSELVVTGVRKGKPGETRFDAEIGKFLVPHDPDVWHRLEKFEQARAEALAIGKTAS